jgi:RNA polymerase sigma-70 factor (ECF subfamily)
MTAEEVIKKIQLLPDIFREVLLLKFVHEMNDKEIAKVLGISPVAARKRVERARQRIAFLCNRG